MNIQQARNQIQQQLGVYLNETSLKTIKEFQEAKKNKKQADPIIQIKKQTPECFQIPQQDEVVINLDEFKFEPHVKQKSWQTQLLEAQQKQQPIYHQIYGYCLEQFKFDSIMERLQLLRKSLFKKKMPNGDIQKIEEFIPFYTLRRMAMQLPTDASEMNSMLQDHFVTEAFLKEIRYFLKQQNIDKGLIFYHPKMYEQSDDQLEQLLAEFVELDKQGSSGLEEEIKVFPSTQLKC
ncbi:unnamed protein product (macronuclear) [Paramecium tetraurelia]|uniref:Uncharacterized protein n=1 Tax=Paramecium tetraurelia TaxID=5888 RepID=A0DGI4_PARTE|nr:uncharacterized protein GSPATT00002280001 [Paramecium tetraurelia]CAK82151.1 unnamed protein product [Paramecium tetraurelia]|eukprot:XP_001449548.1 hypothetical protein (macronuclear) [Paramecium tetraurelia strain d4-2]